MALGSFFESLAEAGGADVGTPLYASAIRAGLNEGMNGSEILSSLRDAGFGIRTQSFYQLLGEVRASTALAGDWSAAPLDQLPGEGLVQEWSGGATDTYLSRIYMYVRTNVGGQLSVERRGVSILTNELITPGDALSMAQELYEENSDSENYANEQLLGAEFGGVYHQTGG